MRIKQEPCHRPPCSAADPPARSKCVIGAARPYAAPLGPWQERRARVSALRRTQRARGGHQPPLGPAGGGERVTSYGWDTCAEMSELSVIAAMSRSMNSTSVERRNAAHRACGG